MGVDETVVVLGCLISSANVTWPAGTFGRRFSMPWQRLRAASLSGPYVLAEQVLLVLMQRVQRPSDRSMTHYLIVIQPMIVVKHLKSSFSTPTIVTH